MSELYVIVKALCEGFYQKESVLLGSCTFFLIKFRPRVSFNYFKNFSSLGQDTIKFSLFGLTLWVIVHLITGDFHDHCSGVFFYPYMVKITKMSLEAIVFGLQRQ